MAFFTHWTFRDLVLVLLLGALAYTTIQHILARYNTSLRSIPGPPLAAWTRLWRFWDVYRGQAHLTNIALHRQHGKLVRVGPKVISCSDPAMIPVIYNTQGTFTKSGELDEGTHRGMKRKLTSAFTPDALLRMEKAIDACGDLLMQRLRDCASESGEIDFGLWLHYYAFDVVGVITYGEKLGFLETGSDIDAVIATNPVLMTYFACFGQIPFLHKLLLGNPILPWLLPQIEASNSIVVYAKKALDRRIKLSSAYDFQMHEHEMGDDMLSRWAAVKAQDSEKMNMTDIMVALSVNVLAGSDTTAIALRATFYYLMRNPDKLKEARAEIDRARQAGHLSSPVADNETRNHLPYINAVIKEALRMHPGTGLIMERHVPKEGAQISGHYLPGGTIVGINAWVVQYDPDVFSEPYQFQPERWLPRGDNVEHLARMERSFLAFGAGSRVCLGRHLSMIELRKIVPRILEEVEIEMVGSQEWKVRNAWFVAQEMPMCKIRLRQ